jgi:hypothetical protein
MPALAHLFGVRPWEIDRLSVRDFRMLCRAVDDTEREAKKGDSGGR